MSSLCVRDDGSGHPAGTRSHTHEVFGQVEARCVIGISSHHQIGYLSHWELLCYYLRSGIGLQQVLRVPAPQLKQGS